MRKINTEDIRYTIKANGRKIEEGVGVISPVKYSVILLSYDQDTYLQFYENGREVASGWGLKEKGA